MPAEFESGFVVGDRAWHGLAEVFETSPPTAEEALTLAGQDWLVDKAPLQALIPNGKSGPREVLVEDRFATYRTDTGFVLGVVGADWTPVQNRTSFRWLDELVDGGELDYESVGVLQGGRKVFIQAKLPGFLEIGGHPNERIKRFILVCNGHAGTLAFRIKLVHQRVVCTNTLGMALSEGGESFVARHTSGIEFRAQAARTVLGVAFREDERFSQMAEELVQTPLDPQGGDFRQFLRRLVPLAPGVEADSRKAKNVEEARLAIRNLAFSGEDLEPVRGTAWAALQAAVEYSDWGTRVIGDGQLALERRFTRNVLKEDAIKSRAVALLAPDYASAGQRRLAGVS
jgi:phage/plasmid-like protein (TIGR03299 family)